MTSSLLLLFIITTASVSIYVQYCLQEAGVRPVASPLPDLPEWPHHKENGGMTTTTTTTTTTMMKWHNWTNRVELVGSDILVGPETLVVSTSPKGTEYLFATLGDGRIVRLEQTPEDDDKESTLCAVQWTTLARTGNGGDSEDDDDDHHQQCHFSSSDVDDTEWQCGRPLGMIVVKRSTVDPSWATASSATGGDKEDDKEEIDEDVLVVADAYRGLLMVTNIYDDGNVQQHQNLVTTLAMGAETDPDYSTFRLLNALVQDSSDGSLYMTETSQTFSRRRIFHAFLDGRSNGRLLKYTKQKGGSVVEVASNLFMPNGITLSHDGAELLLVCGVQILRYSLESQTISSQPLVGVMPGTGGNLKAMHIMPSTGDRRDCYWAGLGSKYAQPFSLLKMVSEKPWLKALLVALVPYETLVDMIPKLSALAVYDTEGNLLEVYQDESALFPWVSEGEVLGNYLFLGSWFNPSLARVRIGGAEAR